MVAHAVLAVIAALVITGGAGAAAVGTGLVHLGNTNTFDLGTLSAGQSGNATLTSSIYSNTSSHFVFELEKEDQINSAFSSFLVYLTVNGTTYNLSAGIQNDAGIAIPAGSNSVQLSLIYTVTSTPVSVNATAVPFLFAHATGNENSQNGQQVKDSSGQALPSESSQDSGNSSAFAYISFVLNGGQSSHGEDQGTDNSVMASRPI